MKTKPVDLGNNIRELRNRLNLTLEDLAERSGVSRAMLSDIERGLKSPTIRTVTQIADSLGATVSQLLDEPEPQTSQNAKVIVTLQKERQVLVDPSTGMERYSLCPAFLQRGIEVLWYKLPSGHIGSFPAHPKGAVEHLTVVEGCLDYQFGDQKGSLEAGDSVWFEADLLHSFHNPTPQVCQFFIVKTFN